MDPDTAWENYQRAIEEGDPDDAYDAAEALVGWINRGGFRPKGFTAADLKAIRRTFARGYGAGAYEVLAADTTTADLPDAKSAYDAGVEDGYGAKGRGEPFDPMYGADYYSHPVEVEAANAGYAAGYAASAASLPKPATSSPKSPAAKAADLAKKKPPAPAAPASSTSEGSTLLLAIVLLGAGYYLTRGR